MEHHEAQLEIPCALSSRSGLGYTIQNMELLLEKMEGVGV